MKKFLYMAVAAIAALSSCSDDEIVTLENENDANAPVFTASIEGNDETRTTVALGEGDNRSIVKWETTDMVNINGAIYKAIPNVDPKSATLTKLSGTTPTGTYHAFFPATLSNYQFPTAQYYSDGHFNMPMYAEGTSTDLKFKNICSVLSIHVNNADIATLKSIKVMADKALSGEFYLSSPEDAKLRDASDNTKTVELVIPSDCQKLDKAGKTFYIAIPAQEYKYLVIFLSSDGTTYREAMATKVAGGIGVIIRNTLWAINYEKNAVQLWDDGLYYATVNVGEKTEAGNTQKYAWGPTTSGGGADSYTLSNDNAYKTWGPAWRTPTLPEFIDFKANCTATYVTTPAKGLRFENTNASAGYGSIFLPFEDAHNANYWTTTKRDPYTAYTVWIQDNVNGTSVTPGYPKGVNSACYVRAVLNLTEPAAPNDPNLLPGKFSVSSDKKVQFTKGNLYWDYSSFQFEAYQYDYPTTRNNDHVGHFYWTTIADYNKTDYSHKPYSIYAYEYTAQTTTDKFWCGEDNKLTVGGTDGLYVLSKDEWAYLLGIGGKYRNEGRLYAATLHKYGVTVAGVENCLVIAPDDYNNTISDSYDAVSWGKAEARGLVCLPPAGWYSSTALTPINGGGKNCLYWTSTPHGTTVTDAYLLRVNLNPSAKDMYSNYRKYGYAIRLVK